MRIAHFSDPHLLSLDGAKFLDFANKRWIGGLNLLANRSRHHRLEVFEAMIEDLNRGGVDHVVATGDITNLALEEEFRFARGYFDRFTLGTERVTVIPGNHDAYVQAGVAHFSAYFEEFCSSDAAWAWSEGPAWPVVRVRGPLALICLSTSLETPWFTAWGRIGSRQLARLGSILSDPRLEQKFRLIAVHHPPAGPPSRSRVRGLQDRAAFAEELAGAGAELCLHGHEHRDLRAELEGPAGEAIPVRGIPSATFVAGKPEHRARYRIYELAEEAAGGRPRLVGERVRVWSEGEGGFVDDAPGPVQAAGVAT